MLLAQLKPKSLGFTQAVSEELEQEILDELVTALGKQRGYASYFQWHDRRVMERGIVTDLMRLAPQHFPGPLLPVVSSESDPPDCLIASSSVRIGVEVTELVDRRFLQAVVGAKKAGHIVYDWASWDRDKFFGHLNARISAKAHPAHLSGGPFDEYILLVHTAEPGLDPEIVSQWLVEVPTTDPGIISRGYILFDYRPGVERLVVEVPLSRGG